MITRGGHEVQSVGTTQFNTHLGPQRVVVPAEGHQLGLAPVRCHKPRGVMRKHKRVLLGVACTHGTQP